MSHIERTVYIATGIAIIFSFWFLIGLLAKVFSYFFMLGWDLW